MKKQIILWGAVFLGSASFSQTWSPLNSNLYNNPTSGNVGIGTNSPLDKLQVDGGLRIQKDGNDASISTQLYIGNNAGAGYNNRGFNFQLSAYNASNYGSLNLWTYVGTWNNRFTFTANGSFGIGTANPGAYFHVIPSSNDITPGFVLENNYTSAGNAQITKVKHADTKALAIQNTSSSPLEVFKIFGDGRTMIGQTNNNPSALFHIYTPNSTALGFFLEHNGSAAGTSAALIRMTTQIPSVTALRIERKDASNNVYNGLTVWANGQTQIGPKPAPSIHSDATLSADGKIICRDLYVLSTSVWPDYVFSNSYKLPSLNEVKQFYEINKHLPGVPTACEIEEKGININEVATIQMQKIEELTIYMVQMKEEIEQLKKENEILKQSLNK
jgi:hypothetical protein